jgi:hypothetical protein
LGFYERKQGLRSWCEDGHPDEHRFRRNGWNPVWLTRSKEEILKWVSAANTLVFTAHETPVDRPIQLPTETAPRPKSQFVSNLQHVWDNSKAKLQQTARQLGMDSTKFDPARRTLDFDSEKVMGKTSSHYRKI